MSVTSTKEITAEDFVRFPRVGKETGLVGTFNLDIEDDGEAGGGFLLLRANLASVNTWGFQPIIVMTAVAVSVDTDPGNVQISYENLGNRRGPLVPYSFDPVIVDSVAASPVGLQMKVVVEPVFPDAQFISVKFGTNTDAKTYHLHGQGIVFDAEILARTGRYDLITELLS